MANEKQRRKSIHQVNEIPIQQTTRQKTTSLQPKLPLLPQLVCSCSSLQAQGEKFLKTQAFFCLLLVSHPNTPLNMEVLQKTRRLNLVRKTLRNEILPNSNFLFYRCSDRVRGGHGPALGRTHTIPSPSDLLIGRKF